MIRGHICIGSLICISSWSMLLLQFMLQLPGELELEIPFSSFSCIGLQAVFLQASVDWAISIEIICCLFERSRGLSSLDMKRDRTVAKECASKQTNKQTNERTIKQTNKQIIIIIIIVVVVVFVVVIVIIIIIIQGSGFSPGRKARRLRVGFQVGGASAVF